MNELELKKKIEGGALASLGLYPNPEAQKKRFLSAVDRFSELYGKGRELFLFSVPGRSELSGNHTDHNRGRVLAGAIDRDIIAVAAKNEDGMIRLKSEGFEQDTVCLSDTENPNNFRRYTSAALIAGICDGFRRRSFPIGGFDAYTVTDVLKGSGISSSAAFEVMVGNILHHLYGDGKTENAELAKIAQYAENRYFGKPCGLMDQMACAVGGFVYIDFENEKNPVVVPIPFSLADAGYRLCIVNTGGNHADLNEDYASVPAEMKATAKALGKTVLREVSEQELIASIPHLRKTVGDRAVLRSLHFLRENERVLHQRDALLSGDLRTFLTEVIASGNSSFHYLQNVYTVKNVAEQGLSLALCLTEGLLSDKGGAWRVHGGGFAGTIQAFVPNAETEAYASSMDRVFGDGATLCLSIRQSGAVQICL